MILRNGGRKPLSDKENSRNSGSTEGEMAGAAKEDVERWRRTQVTNRSFTGLAKHLACK